MFAFLSLLLAVSPAQAGDLLVPSFSLEEGTDAAGAEIMYSAVLEALRAREIEFLDADDIAEFSGNDGLNCAARPECPEILWEKVNGSLAMTATVGLKVDMLTVMVEFHRPGQKGAVEFVQDELPASKAGELAMDLALITQDLLNANLEVAPAVGVAALGDGDPVGDPLGDILPGTGPMAAPPIAASAPPVPDVPEAAAAEPVVQTPADAPADADVDADVDEPEPAAPSSTDATATARTLGVTQRAFAGYADSGLSPDEWAAQMKVRSRKFFVELHAGVVMGDVKRRFATRVAIQQEGESRFRKIGQYERDVMLEGAAFSTAVSLGYTPVWWLEGGLLFGLEFPRKELITGWEAYGPDDDYSTREPGSQDQVVYQPATALTLLIEPRARLLMRSTGTVKPFLLGGYSMRVYDGYDTDDLPQVSFPDRSGLVSSGPMAGLGLSFDARHKSSGFVEASGIKLLTPETSVYGADSVSRNPVEEDGSGFVVSIRAGVTSRF
jgi:hypothetical protein